MLAPLFALGLCIFGSSVQATATITVTSPPAGATPTLNCIVTVAASTNFTPPDQQAGPPVFYFTNNLGGVTSLTGNPVHWDTTKVPNGSVSISASVPYHSGSSSWYTANSAVIIVAVKNGYELNTDPAKTYAKVTLPTSGQSIVANGQSFVITSDHQITWTRYDNCADYGQSYVFKQICTYPNSSNIVVSGGLHLPQQIGDCPVTLTLGTGSSYLAGGATPVTYYVYAFCYTPDQSSQVAQGSSTFTMVPIPH